MDVFGPLTEGIGSSDCELLRDGALAQPVNALTSFAYVVVGAVIILTSRRRPDSIGLAVVYGSLLAAVGIGSVLFHGPQPDGSRWFHDTPITLTLVFIVVSDLRLLTGRPVRQLPVFAVAAAVVLTVATVSLDAGTAMTGAAVVAVVVLEALIARRDLRGVGPVVGRRVVVALVAIVAVAAASYVFGRTGAPTCDPDSIVQLHGLWHVVTAGLFGGWWWLATQRSG